LCIILHKLDQCAGLAPRAPPGLVHDRTNVFLSSYFNDMR
jgi:hypothetical protein